MRPTELPPRGVEDLTDAEAPDFLERHPLCALAFLDGGDDACRRFRARLDALAARHAGLALGALDVRRSPLVAEALGVKSVPMLIVFRDGEAVDRVIGAPPDAVIEDVVRLRTRS